MTPTEMLDPAADAALFARQWSWWAYGFSIGLGWAAVGSLIRMLKSMKRGGVEGP